MTLTDNTLQQVNLANLQWLETYSSQVPALQVNGIEILRCFTYDLIQIFNNHYLKEQLNDTHES
jgi:hypothetical protein